RRRALPGVWIRLTGHACQGKCSSPTNRGLARPFGDPIREARSAVSRGARGAHRQTIRNLACMRQRRPVRGVIVLLLAALLVVSGCARFAAAQPHPSPPHRGLTPGPPPPPPPPPPLPPKPFPKVCPAPGVMQGCLESTSGLIMGPDSQSALVAERTT